VAVAATAVEVNDALEADPPPADATPVDEPDAGLADTPETDAGATDDDDPDAQPHELSVPHFLPEPAEVVEVEAWPAPRPAAPMNSEPWAQVSSREPVAMRAAKSERERAFDLDATGAPESGTEPDAVIEEAASVAEEDVSPGEGLAPLVNEWATEGPAAKKPAAKKPAAKKPAAKKPAAGTRAAKESPSSRSRAPKKPPTTSED
jgi:hypothetical protein